MKKSTVNLVNVLKGHLIDFPNLVKSLENKDPLFINKLLAWIVKNEEILSTYSISEVSELSGLYSKLLVPRFEDKLNTSFKKTQLKVASEILYDLQSLVLNVLKPFELKVEECRDLVKQLLLLISQAKVVKYDPNEPFEEFVATIWQITTSHEQLKAGAIKLKTLLIMSDIQILIAQEIDLEDF